MYVSAVAVLLPSILEFDTEIGNDAILRQKAEYNLLGRKQDAAKLVSIGNFVFKRTGGEST